MMWVWFFLAAAVIFFAGRYLSDLAEETAVLTGLSRGFIGALLLGIITSLPELIGTLTAAVFKANADLGVGNIFGSNLFNIAILSLCTMLYGAHIARHTWSWKSNYSAYMAISLSAFMVMLIGMYLMGVASHPTASNLIILAFYLLGMWVYARQGGDGEDADNPPESGPRRSLKANLVLVALFGGLVVLAGVMLAHACDQIARSTEMTSTFVGSLFMAAATSLPELVVTMRLLRLGRIGMATGNIFGSNAMNLTIIAIVDLCYRGTLYATITTSQLVTLGGGILMSGLFLSGALIKSGGMRIRLHLDNVTIIVLYVWVYYWLYHH